MKPKIVAVYLESLAYGGPEEGGWWYTEGSLVRIVKVCASDDAAYRFANRMERLLDKILNKDRRPLSSVLSTGRYSAVVFDEYAPKHYPETRPHYE